MSVLASTRAAMRPTVRDVMTHPWRNLAGIVLIALAVGLVTGVVSYENSRSFASGYRQTTSHISYHGGSCVQSVNGQRGRCTDEAGGVLWSTEGESSSDAPAPGSEEPAVEVLTRVLPEGLSAPYEDNFSLEVTSKDGSIVTAITQRPAEYSPAATAPRLGEIFLSQEAAGHLKARVGDTVTISALAGHHFRPGESDQTIELTVANISPSSTSTVAEPQWRDPSAVTLGEVNWWGLHSAERLNWEQVRSLNASGFIVDSHDFDHSPPPAEKVDPEFRDTSTQTQGPGYYSESLFWGVMYATMLGIVSIVVLSLVSPVFMIAAVRQSQVYALMRSQGATRAHIRATVVAYGLVYGIIGTAVGLGFGLAVSFALWKLRYPAWPFHVTWWHIGLIGAVAILGAVGSAFIPAVIQSRQDIIAGVQGAHPGRMLRPTRWMWAGPGGLAVLGAVLAGIQAIGPSDGSQFWFGLLTMPATFLALLGLIASGPAILVLASGTRRSLPLRLAGRQLRRLATRSLPAIAAIMSIVFITLISTTSMLSNYAHSAMLRSQVVSSELAALAPQSDSVTLEELREAEASARVYLGPGASHTARTVAFADSQYTTIRTNTEADSYAGPIGAMDYTYLPGELSYGIVEVDVDAIDLFRLSEEERASAKAALAAGGLLLPKAAPSVPVYVEKDTVTVTTTNDDFEEEDAGTFTLPVAYVLPRGIDSVLLSPAATSTLQGTPGRTVVYLQYEQATARDLRRAEKAVSESMINTTLQTVDYVPFTERWLAMAGVLSVVVAVLGLVIALSFQQLRSASYQLSAIGASMRTLRRTNAAYFGLLTACATIPAGVVSTLGVFLTRQRALVDDTGLLQASQINSFTPDVPGLVLFVVAAPLLAAGIGYFATPTAGIAYRED